MNEAIEFKTVEELYKRLKPALYSKITELKRTGLDYIKEEDIWNYLKEVKWQEATNLSLSEMINDILNTENEIIDRYFKNKLQGKTRITYFKGADNEEEHN